MRITNCIVCSLRSPVNIASLNRASAASIYKNMLENDDFGSDL
jgi:hypothetical protein